MFETFSFDLYDIHLTRDSTEKGDSYTQEPKWDHKFQCEWFETGVGRVCALKEWSSTINGSFIWQYATIVHGIKIGSLWFNRPCSTQDPTSHTESSQSKTATPKQQVSGSHKQEKYLCLCAATLNGFNLDFLALCEHLCSAWVYVCQSPVWAEQLFQWNIHESLEQ